VLLLGASGAGKSDLALRLIERGALLVADDRTELFVRDGRLMGRAPTRLAGFLEIRGLGILQFPFAKEGRIVLAVMLDTIGVQRLPEPETYQAPAALDLPAQFCPALLRLDSRESSAVAKIMAAAGDMTRIPSRNCRHP
jgi:serine kinase of HPr protein (carbohydrate metabolism regulator)